MDKLLVGAMTKWKKADLHVHSSCSYDVLKVPHLHPRALYEVGLRKGMDFVTITDHDTMKAYDIIGWNKKKLVTGVEVSIKDEKFVGHTIHTNVYTLNKRQFSEIMEIAHKERSVRSYVKYCKENELPFMYNHPFWVEHGETPNIENIPKVSKLFPVLEYNLHRVRRKNSLSVALARKQGKGMIAATDTHIGLLGIACTLAHGKNFTEFFDNIVKGDCQLIMQDLSFTNINSEVGAWIDTIRNLKMEDLKFDTKAGPVIQGLVNKMYKFKEGSPRLANIALGAISLSSSLGIPGSIYLFKEYLAARRMNSVLKLV